MASVCGDHYELTHMRQCQFDKRRCLFGSATGRPEQSPKHRNERAESFAVRKLRERMGRVRA